ncbi:hypothetical protein B9Z55_008047 [Caenorhabditis nigoni]|uniref:C2H2-type domain-containing protein n=1 Tax=Caenorhabditis nigoni TaxID=1611254 RepID=A0A2G5VCG7_9PELO|nr:hypothetical protein B9Z55_008047 [Caenorhabditis nigoni]
MDLDKYFSELGIFKKEKKIIQRPTICPYCSQMLSSFHSMKIHSIRHWAETSTNFECPEFFCSHKYGSYGHLVDHMRTNHFGIPSMYCKECGHKSVCYTGLLVHYHADHVMNCQEIAKVSIHSSNESVSTLQVVQRNVVSMDASSMNAPESQNNGYKASIQGNPFSESSAQEDSNRGGGI